MLCFPIEKKPDWRKPPVITLLLILINAFCFFAFQLDDNEESAEVQEFYFTSGLNKIELPRFYTYAIEKYDYKEVVEIQAAKKNMQAEDFDDLLAGLMFQDGVFYSKLLNSEIITTADPVYKEWKSLRTKVNALWDKVTFYRYGLKPNNATPETYITNMFLHGGFEHLFWNMVFLFLFGFIVEKAIGWKIYLPAYLLAGIGSGILYVLMEPASPIPGVGASGAIAGLAGMYTVLFGLRKVRFFVYLFFYFDTIKLPAIIMLPVWIGYEFYSHYFIDSGVNNLAHAGGYITGAVIIAVLKLTKRQVNEEYLDDEIQKDVYDQQYLLAQQALAALDFKKAGRLFTELEAAFPEDLNIKRNLFNISKIDPATEAFHHYAGTILSLPNVDVQTVKVQREVFNDYVAKAHPGPRLKLAQLSKLAIRFAKHGHFDEADKIAVVLLKNKLKSSEVSEVLLLLVKNLQLTKPERAKQYRAALAQMAPEKVQQLGG